MGQRDVVLASTAKRSSKVSEMHSSEIKATQSYGSSSAAARRSLGQRCASRGASVMPRWVSQDRPKLFAPNGGVVDVGNELRTFEEFSLYDVYRSQETVAK